MHLFILALGYYKICKPSYCEYLATSLRWSSCTLVKFTYTTTKWLVVFHQLKLKDVDG